ncbi:MAG: N-acetylneuraminate synthase [Desulfotomaculum sp. 46_296]|nr:MAG: N-acetylneuraminate synthase [Desulfotomaculum sp. 46_296]HAU32285.1 N-acetylneuraminate synthase [Desulfotomaculum sp.]
MTGNSRVFIIAEVGVNHNGSLDLAMQMVDLACKSGADAVKFQTFKAERIVTSFAERALYQQKNMPHKFESQLEMIKKLELSFDDFRKLKEYCDRRRIAFLSSPFDLESVNFLDELNLDCFKIPSGEITNLPLLRRIGGKRKKVILSTGMSTLEEVGKAVQILNSSGAGEITLLHCTSNYPTPPEEVNLKAMLTLKQAFGLPVGYSDHTMGYAVSIAAVAMGAEVIEKHFTLNRKMEGPDHKCSLEPDELNNMVEIIRLVEKSFGNGLKAPVSDEIKIAAAARSSIVSSKNIPAGERITEDCLAAKRPGTGISPMFWDSIIGRRASVDIPAETVLTWEMIEDFERRCICGLA